MKHRVWELFLLLVVVVGGILAWNTGRQRSRLQAEYQRLSRLTGDIPIADPTQVYMRAIETGEPLHFAWRVYLPPNYRQIVTDSSGSSSSSWSSGATEFITRVRFREDEQGLLQVHTRFSGGSGRMSLGDQSLAKLLRGRWDKIHVEQLGGDDLITLKPDQSAVLLRLTLPDDIQNESREKLNSHIQERCVPVLFELQLGPKISKP